MTNPTPHGQVPEPLRLADALERPGYGWHSTPAQCAAELRSQYAELETLRAGYAAARLEVESLRGRGVEPADEYPVLPEPITYQIAVLKACEHGDALVGWRVEPSRQSFDASMRPKRKLYTEGDMHDFADRTHALRASHGQAPADAKALAEADRRAGEAERLLATYKEDVMRFEQVRSRMKYQWGADQRVSFDEVWDEALALKKAAQAAPTTQPSPAAQEDALDAARYRFLRDGEWRDTDLEPFIRLQLNTLWDAKIDAARKEMP